MEYWTDGMLKMEKRKNGGVSDIEVAAYGLFQILNFRFQIENVEDEKRRFFTT